MIFVQLSILLAVALAVVGVLYLQASIRHRLAKTDAERQYENSQFWYKKWLASTEDYVALEQGRDEESSDYEQLYLSQQEMIVNRDFRIRGLEEDRQALFVLYMWHEMHCLPDLEVLAVGGIIDKEQIEDIKLRMGVLTG